MDNLEMETVGCLVLVAIALFVIACCCLIGHIFGAAVGFAVLLVLAAAFVLLVAVNYWKRVGGGDK